MTFNLETLRNQIDIIDKKLLHLISQRLILVTNIGKIKHHMGLPIYDINREIQVITSIQETGKKFNISSKLIEDIFYRLIQESYVQENYEGFKKLNPSLHLTIIIGNDNYMGTLFEKMLTLSGYRTIILQAENILKNKMMLLQANMIIINVPVSIFQYVINNLPILQENCILISLSIRNSMFLRTILKIHAGPVLGIHPLFEANVNNLVKKNMIYCHGNKPELYQWLLKQIKLWGVQLYCMNSEDYDKNISSIQKIYCFIILFYSLYIKKENINLEQLFKISSEIHQTVRIAYKYIVSCNTNIYDEMINVLKNNSECIQYYYHWCGELINILKQNDQNQLLIYIIKVIQQFQNDTNFKN